MKYIDADKLIAEIERRIEEINIECQKSRRPQYFLYGKINGLEQSLNLACSLQQEQPKDKQIIIITESHGDANIEWDCRSLDDVIALLKNAESFITEKQIEKIAGPGSGSDYATTEGRYSHLFKSKQGSPDVDLDKELNQWRHKHFKGKRDEVYSGEYLERESQLDLAIHFYELGLNVRKEKTNEST